MPDYPSVRLNDSWARTQGFGILIKIPVRYQDDHLTPYLQLLVPG